MEALQEKLGEQGDERSQFLTEARYAEICDALDGFYEKDGCERKKLEDTFGQVYARARKYE